MNGIFAVISATFRTFDIARLFAIPPKIAFSGHLEEFFLSISKIRNIYHIINQFVRKFSAFPDSP
ncbi:MAG: hypothetical protein MJZ12_11340, partial [Prevotella sp.]|nr:hypothetical protein [Prevotella sp.]